MLSQNLHRRRKRHLQEEKWNFKAMNNKLNQKIKIGKEKGKERMGEKLKGLSLIHI